MESSPKLSIDNRLLAIEELIRQRQYREAISDLRELVRIRLQGQ